jgi:hypothetical protein
MHPGRRESQHPGTVNAHDRHVAPGSCLSYLANEHSDARIALHAEVVSLDSYDHVSATSAAISDSFASWAPYRSFMRAALFVMERTGIEPVTSGLQSRRSPS